MASGAVAYLGAFNVVFRNEIIDDWREACERVRAVFVLVVAFAFNENVEVS